MSQAVCDNEALLPLQGLIQGPLTTLDDIPGIERFLRTVVLHDQLEVEQFPRTLHFTETEFIGTQEELRAWRFDHSVLRQLIEHKTIEVYLGRKNETEAYLLSTTKDTGLEMKLSLGLVQLAADYARSDDQVAHGYLASLKHILAVVRQGGSALLGNEFGTRALALASNYPEALFCELDQKWQMYARKVEEDGFTLAVPPVLGIVLTRCARRDAIPAVIRDLRDEWAGARKKVWTLLDAQRRAVTLDDAAEIRRELSDASKLFAPEPTDHDSRPIRVLWEIIAAATAGAGIAALSGGKPVVGAITGAVAHVPRSVPALLHEFGPALFGRGAFDLARRVRRAVSEIELGALERLLSDAEKQTLGFE